MNSELQIFENSEFGAVRTVAVGDKTYFVASDVAKALGYANPHDAIIKHCRWVAKCEVPHPQSKTKTLEINVIPEGDLYRLISNSELQNAQKFESWMFDEVLPSIRKHGVYAVDELLNDPDLAIKAFTALKEERQKNKQLQEDNKNMKPNSITFATTPINFTVYEPDTGDWRYTKKFDTEAEVQAWIDKKLSNAEEEVAS